MQQLQQRYVMPLLQQLQQRYVMPLLQQLQQRYVCLCCNNCNRGMSCLCCSCCISLLYMWTPMLLYTHYYMLVYMCALILLYILVHRRSQRSLLSSLLLYAAVYVYSHTTIYLYTGACMRSVHCCMCTLILPYTTYHTGACLTLVSRIGLFRKTRRSDAGIFCFFFTTWP